MSATATSRTGSGSGTRGRWSACARKAISGLGSSRRMRRGNCMRALAAMRLDFQNFDDDQRHVVALARAAAERDQRALHGARDVGGAAARAFADHLLEALAAEHL